MIITPNIGIDNTHMNAFQNEFQTMNSLEDPGTTVRGTGDMKGLNITVKKIRTLQGNGIMLAVHNKNEGILVCRLVSAPVPQGAFPWGRRVYVMDQIRVHPDYIGRGLAPLVYRWLADNGYTVLSDSHQTPTSLAVWRKMATQGGVFTVNLKDGTWRPYDPTRVEDWVLFGNGDYSRYWPVRFVLPETKN
jgi:hypothetical protein